MLCARRNSSSIREIEGAPPFFTQASRKLSHGVVIVSDKPNLAISQICVGEDHHNVQQNINAEVEADILLYEILVRMKVAQILKIATNTHLDREEIRGQR